MAIQDYVAITKVAVGDTIMVLLYLGYPVYPSTTSGSFSWLVAQGKPKKSTPYTSSFFGGTVRSNNTSTGVLTVVGSPSALEGYHQHLKPGTGCSAQGSNTYKERTGLLELPYPYIRRAFILIPHPTHPGERPTTTEELHPPYFLKYVRLDRRY